MAKKATQLRVVKKEQDDFDFSTWQMVSGGSKSRSVGANEFYVLLNTGTSLSKRTNRVVLRFGTALAKKLNIKLGDKIGVFHHPDDLMEFAVIKHVNGYTVQKNANSNILNITFSWHNKFNLKKTKGILVDYTIHKLGYLVFRMPNPNILGDE